MAAGRPRLTFTCMLLMLSTTALQMLAIVKMVSALEMRSLRHGDDASVRKQQLCDA